MKEGSWKRRKGFIINQNDGNKFEQQHGARARERQSVMMEGADYFPKYHHKITEAN